MTKTFSLRPVARAWKPDDDNVDVEVVLEDGRRFGATFFTIANITKLFEKNRRTGECAGGLYFWADHMIVVETLTSPVMERTTEDLLQTGEFEHVFELLPNVEPSHEG